MRLIFFGTSDFAIPSLKKIMESHHELVAVVTQPDRKRGRSLSLAPPPVKLFLEKKNIPVHQPADLSLPEIISVLRGYDADIFIVAAFGQIFKKEILQIPKRLCVNVHASLLPKYRGASPINWAVINGDKKSGVTAIRMDEGMDSGDIILEREVDILDEDTSGTLSEKLSAVGAELLMETVDLLEKGEAEFRKQDEERASFAYKLKKSDGLIDWSMHAGDIHNRVRGLVPWPGAYTHWDGRLLKIWKSSFDERPVKTNDIANILTLDSDGIVVGTARGGFIIEILQLEGGKKIKSSDFLRGHNLKVGDTLG